MVEEGRREREKGGRNESKSRHKVKNTAGQVRREKSGVLALSSLRSLPEFRNRL